MNYEIICEVKFALALSLSLREIKVKLTSQTLYFSLCQISSHVVKIAAVCM